MKHLLVLMIFVTAACSSAPKTETKIDESDHDHGALKVKACVFDSMVLIMSLGDPRVLENFCTVTPEKEALWNAK